MQQSKLFMTLFMSIIIILSFACSDNSTNPEGSDEAGESGKSWAISDTAMEIVNGIRLTLSFNSTDQAFEGTLENLNTVVSPLVRVEVHVFDAAGKSNEYGPTTPKDMEPGEKRDVTLPVPGAGDIATFQMHPEVGSGGGEGSGG